MPQASARHILVENESQCQDLIQQLEQGGDFETLARQHSQCPSGARGGDLGSFGPGMMVPEFDKVVFEGELGKPLGPVKTQFGYHVVEITERTD